MGIMIYFETKFREQFVQLGSEKDCKLARQMVIAMRVYSNEW